MHRNLNRLLTVASIAGVTVAAWTSAALAAGPPQAVNDLPTVIGNMTTWITGILAAVATLFLTIGGARYLMAGDDPSEVERAKGALKSAGIGYALALLAPVILTILKNILGVA
jgi:Type IV secretion system pilin